MIIATLNKEIESQQERNLRRYGKQPRATLILEMEDQMGKLRDTFLHRTDDQVLRRLVNIGSLIWAIAKELPELGDK